MEGGTVLYTTNAVTPWFLRYVVGKREEEGL